MFTNRWKKYSYVYQKNYFSRLRLLILKALLVILIYFVLTNFFFQALLMESSSMQPSISPGDRMFFSLFTIHDLMSDMSLLDSLPYQRGDIVTVDMSSEKEGFFEAAADRFFRLWTAGRVGLPGK